MDLNRKTTGLKSLQGKIWDAGYAQGHLLGVVYPDVVQALKKWKEAGVPVYIYSSGSVHAQKLLFGHTEHGNLLPFFSGHFDTLVGAKVEKASYLNISKEIGIPPSALLFCTDIYAEAVAARDAGLVAVVVRRPGNGVLPEKNEFQTITTFDEL
mmetsp:Transcript_41904/g.67959  ORF Transcript_41904/g.67959 Transcript_41904/m.67959 type:complete len:154 (+) Transcript_41904:367-828(+)